MRIEIVEEIVDEESVAVLFRTTVYDSDKDGLIESLSDYVNHFDENKVVRKDEHNCFKNGICEIVSVRKYVDEDIEETLTVQDVLDVMPDYLKTHYEAFNYTEEIIEGKDNYSISDVLCEMGYYELCDESVVGDFRNLADYANYKIVRGK